MDQDTYMTTGKELKTAKIGPKLWLVLKDFTMGGVTVPKMFVTDGASVPRAFHNILAPMAGAHAEAAIIHDFLYSLDSHSVTRKFADQKFYDLMRDNGTPWFRAKLAYRTVRMFGGTSFRKMRSFEKIYSGSYSKTTSHNVEE